MANGTRLRKAAERATKNNKLGTGSRFRAVERSIESNVKPRPGQTKAEAAGAIAASIGRKKFGNKRFQQLSAMGRARGK